jgi:hypothetical protein
MDETSFKWIAAALLCTTLIAGAAALYYMNECNRIESSYSETINELQSYVDDYTIQIDILIDYGNETYVWYNDTRIAIRESLLNATSTVTIVDKSSSEFGDFVNTINGVGGEANKFWIWSYYDEGWQPGMVGADQWIMQNGDIVSWTYSSFG